MLYRGYVFLPPLFVTVICISDQPDLYLARARRILYETDEKEEFFYGIRKSY